MGKDSNIGWTDHTFNPWHGCTKVGTDCKNCYAEAQSHRYGHDVWGPNKPRKAVSDARWKEVLKWNAEAEDAGVMMRVFCGSMMDVFEDPVPVVDWQGEPMPMFSDDGPDADELGDATTHNLRKRLWKLIEATRWLDWLLLTKRPENINNMIPDRWRDDTPRNVMFGMSAGNQETFDERFPAFCEVKGRKFLSLEPLIGCIEYYPTDISQAVDWVIVGGESGHGARPFEVEWVRSIVAACQEVQVPVYVKQLGSKPYLDEERIRLLGRSKGENWYEWPSELDDLKVREFPAQSEPMGEPS